MKLRRQMKLEAQPLIPATARGINSWITLMNMTWLILGPLAPNSLGIMDGKEYRMSRKDWIEASAMRNDVHYSQKV